MIPIGELHAEKIAEAVLFCVFKIVLPSSLLYFNVPMLSYPGAKFPILVKSKVNICAVVVLLFRTLFPGLDIATLICNNNNLVFL